MTYFVHIANVLYLGSYLVRDILWLRCLTIVAGTALMPFYLMNELYAPIGWNVLFIAINAYQVKVLLMERRPVTMNQRQERLYHLVFRALRPREFLKLLTLGKQNRAKSGDTVVEQGQTMDRLLLIENGRAAVQVDGRTVAELGPGRFVGEMSYLTGDPTSARVSSSGDLEFVEWPREKLDGFLEKNPDTKSSLQLVIGTDLVGKLRTT